MTDTPARRWLSLHCYLHWAPPDIDAFLTGTVAPTLDRLREQGRIADRFFIRYGEGGPHLRIRVADAAPSAETWLPAELTRLVAQAPYPTVVGAGRAAERADTGWHPHGTVTRVQYVPEIERYGGLSAITEAEEVFCRSTDVALRVLAKARSTRARLAAATEFIIATALALGLDRLAACRWLRAHAAGWRWQTETAMPPLAIGEVRTISVLASQTSTLQRRWQRIEKLVSTATGQMSIQDPVTEWVSALRRARRRVEAAHGDIEPSTAPGRWPVIWAAQLHMLLNRLGIAPAEERLLCRLVAGAAVLPDGIQPFFADGAAAPDRVYHEASKYLPGQLDLQRPRDSAAPETQPPPQHTATVPLPRGDLGPVALADALRRRRSGRGQLTGPLTATELGTLLWSAHGRLECPPSSAGQQPNGSAARLPYPSAGQQYVARLRLVARRVIGLAPGTYEADPFATVLRPIGPPPSDTDLKATSMWFGDRTVAPNGIDISAMPAMLGLYVRLPTIRARYGLRSLRFALLEAGHLAQNLALVAASAELELSMIGGFYDDLANEVFGLDGIDQSITYLLPIGRRS